MLAERSGLRIHEVPVDWVDDPDSRVDIVATAVADLQGHRPAAARLRHRRDPGQHDRGAARRPRAAAAPRSLLRQVVRFGAVGVASTAAYLVLFVLLQGWAGAQRRT